MVTTSIRKKKNKSQSVSWMGTTKDKLCLSLFSIELVISIFKFRTFSLFAPIIAKTTSQGCFLPVYYQQFVFFTFCAFDC